VSEWCGVWWLAETKQVAKMILIYDMRYMIFLYSSHSGEISKITADYYYIYLIIIIL